ncbi:MAG: FeoA domain-containing protein [bacterium]
MNTIASWLLTIVVVVFSVMLFWPKSGLLWKRKRGLRHSARVLIEDALKHLYDQEYEGLKCTLHSISGTLEISGDESAKLMARLESLGLLQSRKRGFHLTLEGRKYALRMIRIHRLWERYFADETGLAETEWHVRAERLEHKTTEKDLDDLAEKIGNPAYDPHGDPIPTRSGKLPPKRGHAMTDLKEGQLARIVHVEDEPSAIYAQLVAQGLTPGVQVQILEKTSERIQFVADGEENVLAPVVAANVTIEPVQESERIPRTFDSLDILDIGQKGEVVAISKTCRSQQRRRLMDLGVIPGTTITAELLSASGDPIAYNIRGATIALRKEQARTIHIKRIEELNKNGNA